ncbi:hypothetical protein OG897_28445 [Streptomyces sp. NBC_00237]|uniref:hypothetical protein n=1 Tax=Streptomyces sp. NBC_00237 TaxID=2975687 RepID=UPI002254E476|nr:hypothetical protein [Streptomyces sp. NBC_00237]MCX5205376.1 hypothetical protein [Streptomyces sp. NBC_00237]
MTEPNIDVRIGVRIGHLVLDGLPTGPDGRPDPAALAAAVESAVSRRLGSALPADVDSALVSHRIARSVQSAVREGGGR